jgi:hypothetical protein
MIPKLRTGYAGYLLPESERDRLLGLFKPCYERLIAHHVTLAFGVDETYEIPSIEKACVVGSADDGTGVQALIVEINGTYHRPDGSKYHITWSLAEGRKAVESNDILKSWPFLGSMQRCSVLFEPTEVQLEPRFFPFGA